MFQVRHSDSWNTARFIITYRLSVYSYRKEFNYETGCRLEYYFLFILFSFLFSSIINIFIGEGSFCLLLILITDTWKTVAGLYWLVFKAGGMHICPALVLVSVFYSFYFIKFSIVSNAFLRSWGEGLKTEDLTTHLLPPWLRPGFWLTYRDGTTLPPPDCVPWWLK